VDLFVFIPSAAGAPASLKSTTSLLSPRQLAWSSRLGLFIADFVDNSVSNEWGPKDS
jgi:hypothetical protein